MADNGRHWTQLRTAFQAELEDRVQNLNDLLLRMERDDGGEESRGETAERLLREAHNLKGAARAVEAPQIEQIAHQLESALADASRAGNRPSQAWFDSTYRVIDSLIPLGLPMAHAPTQESRVDLSPASLPSVPAPAEIQASTVVSPSQGDRTETVRVAVGKLDDLLAQSGELTVANMRVESRVRELGELRDGIDTWRREISSARGTWTSLRQLVDGDRGDGDKARSLIALLSFADRAEQQVRNLQQKVEALYRALRTDSAELRLVNHAFEDEVLSARLLPVSTIFAPFERMVRDLAREQQKKAQLLQEGGDVEVDRRILDQLRDPLMHMVRNSVDHGVETPAAREAAGKPVVGTLRLTATQRNGSVEIELSDDGAGIDVSAIRRAAVSCGLITPEQAEALDANAATELMYQPGLTTNAAVTTTSGRGVGMDVVRDNVGRLGGTITVASTPGEGTQFRITAPLSLATVRGLIVEQNGATLAIPSAMVERAARIRRDDIRSVEGRSTISYEGQAIPAVELAVVLERPQTGDDTAWRTYLILGHEDRRVALLTDTVAGEREMVVKPLGWPLRRVRNVSGTAVLGSGEIAIVLNPADLARSALRVGSGPDVKRAPQVRQRARVLVVDDSVTTRTLERSILEAAGYETLAAANGLEALTLLRGGTIDLVVSDVEMPELDGFALTAEIRRSEELRQIPVILVTSMDEQEHRSRGMEAGADAYLVKSAFEEDQLLDAVGRLI